MTYSAENIIGKSLYAKKPVDLTRIPGGEIIYTVEPGEMVGVVYSYLQRGGQVYWMFYDNKQRTYYAKHDQNLFSVKALKEQGVKTIEEEIKEQKEQSKTTGERVQSLIEKGLLAASATALLIAIIKNS